MREAPSSLLHGGKGKRRGKEFRGDGKKEERNIVSGMAYKAKMNEKKKYEK